MAFEWLVKLNDAFTDPATRVQKSIRNVTASLRELQAVQKEGRALENYVHANNPQLSTSVRNAARVKGDLAMKQAELLQLRNQKAALDNTGGAWSSFTNRMKENRQAIRDWLIIAQPITQVLGFLAGFTMKAANTIFPVEKIGEAIKIRQDARIGFEAAFGGNSEKMLQMTQDLATRTGRPVTELFHEASNFGNLGAPQDQIRPMLLAISDAKAMGLEFGKLNTVFEASLSKPVGTLKEISEGLRGVVDETKLWAHLADDVGKAMGRSVSIGEVGELFKQHRIGGGFVRQAVLETLQDREGQKLGAVTFKRADTTLGGSLDTFEQRITSIYANVEKSEGFRTFKSAMDNVLTSLGSEKFQKLVDNIANKLGTAFEPLTGSNGKERIDNFFERISLGIQKVLPLLSMMAKATIGLTRWFSPTAKDLKDIEAEDERQQKVNEELDKAGNQKVKKGLLGLVGLGHTSDEFPDYDLPKEKTYTIGGVQLSEDEYFEWRKSYLKKNGVYPNHRGADGEFEYKINDKRVNKKDYDTWNSEFKKGMHHGPGETSERRGFGPINVEVNVHAAGNADHKAIGQAAKEGTLEGLADAMDRINVESP